MPWSWLDPTPALPSAVLIYHLHTITIPAHTACKQASHLDVGLADGLEDKDYLAAVAEALPSVLSEFRPDLVLYDAGVDVHAADALGRLQVSDEGLRRREMLVLDTCLSQGVPVAGATVIPVGLRVCMPGDESWGGSYGHLTSRLCWWFTAPRPAPQVMWAEVTMTTWTSSPIDTSGCIGQRLRCGRTTGFELAQHS